MNDLEVVRRVQMGESEQFSLLVEKYHRQLLSFIHRLLGDPENVEDVGQEVFLSVYRSIRSFDMERGVPFSAWLFITARNRCVSELRKKRPAPLGTDALADLAARGANPEEDFRSSERVEAIRRALEQLPEPYRETLMESLGGEPPAEIARRLDISGGTLKSRLSRARQKMRLLLQGSPGGTSHG
ncbi:MAG: sigma-70 family RNA polymerase sigma factor [Acidobacteria bacterium]|nr:sigma-70 family RNA polymerase sigma factor [Acidobacteriota bacterium]